MRAGRAFNVERGMTIAGIALAALVTGFAYLAIERNDGTPRIGGAEHLAIFAMPSGSRETRVASGAPSVSARSSISREGSREPIDYLPTATIKRSSVEQFNVRQVLRDRVILQRTSGLLELRPGDFAEGFGRLQEIRSVRGQWIAVVVPDSLIDHNSR